MWSQWALCHYVDIQCSFWTTTKTNLSLLYGLYSCDSALRPESECSWLLRCVLFKLLIFSLCCCNCCCVNWRRWPLSSVPGLSYNAEPSARIAGKGGRVPPWEYKLAYSRLVLKYNRESCNEISKAHMYKKISIKLKTKRYI